MAFGRRLHLVSALALGSVLAPFSAASPQDSQSQQSSSVAEAARRARAQKKKSDKAPKVITDETFPATHQPGKDAINVGAPPEPVSPEDTARAAGEQSADKEADEAAAKEDAEITELKKQLAEAEKQLDLQKREFALDSEAYYSKPDFANDKAGKAKLDAEQQAIQAQQPEVDRLKARLAPMLERQSRRKPKGSQSPASQNEKAATPAPPQS